MHFLRISYRNPGKIFEILYMLLKVHKNEIFFGCDCEFCTVSLLVMRKYQDFVKKIWIVPLMGEIRTNNEIVQNQKSEPKDSHSCVPLIRIAYTEDARLKNLLIISVHVQSPYL